MCGIAGAINSQNVDLGKIIETLKHRGPDAQNVYCEDNFRLIHTRLAIQDVAQGIQPFHFQDFVIVFNGEIYNHQALRVQLPEFNFKTNSDTETLLYLFIKYQYKVFELLDGMFAFCIYDKKNRKLILARDRAGKKPLYYYQLDNEFIFASELNTIKAVKKLTINPNAIQNYLRGGFIWKPYTPYLNVFEVPAASYLILDIETNHFKIESYFNLLSHVQEQPINFSDALLELDKRLVRSVNDRVTASDVEVGVFLSGGIDSNLVAAIAAQQKSRIKTFTVRFDSLYDESALAKLTAHRYQTEHIELNISPNLSQDIEKILIRYGEPFMDSSAIPTYYVSQAASQYVKVVLSGDGADELFGGYRRYVPAANNLLNYFKVLSRLLKFFPKPKQKQSMYNYFYRLACMSRKQDLDFYLSATSDIFEDVYLFENNPVTKQLNDFVRDIFSSNLTSLQKMLYADFSILLFCDLLVKMDIGSMAHSVEVRSPFLSKYLLEFAPTLPDVFKVNRLKTKYILRKLAEKYLSAELIKQPKRGFEVPLKYWIEHDLKNNIGDKLRPGCYAENYIPPKFLQNLLANKIPVAAEKRAKMLWSLYCLEVWYQNE